MVILQVNNFHNTAADSTEILTIFICKLFKSVYLNKNMCIYSFTFYWGGFELQLAMLKAYFWFYAQGPLFLVEGDGVVIGVSYIQSKLTSF